MANKSKLRFEDEAAPVETPPIKPKKRRRQVYKEKTVDNPPEKPVDNDTAVLPEKQSIIIENDDINLLEAKNSLENGSLGYTHDKNTQLNTAKQSKLNHKTNDKQYTTIRSEDGIIHSEEIANKDGTPSVLSRQSDEPPPNFRRLETDGRFNLTHSPSENRYTAAHAENNHAVINNKTDNTVVNSVTPVSSDSQSGSPSGGKLQFTKEETKVAQLEKKADKYGKKLDKAKSKLPQKKKKTVQLVTNDKGKKKAETDI